MIVIFLLILAFVFIFSSSNKGKGFNSSRSKKKLFPDFNIFSPSKDEKTTVMKSSRRPSSLTSPSKPKKRMKPHFRTHKKDGHPAYIYSEKGDEYKFIGITHSDNTHKLNNKKLRVNPNANDERPSYARPFSTHDKKSNFKNKKLKGYKLHKADKKLVKKIRRNYVE